MKRYIFFVITAAMLFAACRKEADYIPYTGEYSKLAYDNYTEQFQYLWKCMSTGYILWDVDTTDWDAAYTRFLPRFQALDQKYNDSGYVRTAELTSLYTALVGKMRDHHMAFLVKNLHPVPGDTVPWVGVSPGQREVESRDYYIESRKPEQAGIKAFFRNIGNHYAVSEADSASYFVKELGSTVDYRYCIITLADGRKVPYLWTSQAAITPTMRDAVGSPAQMLLDRWFSTIAQTPRNQLAGILLDNRANGGGYQDDLDYLVGSFINSRTEIMKTRYKEGPGRLEYSAWCPYYQNPSATYHRDLTAENIPYVVLVDVNSVSMGEIEPMVIKAVIPTAHIIGERTFGGTCPLQPDAESLTYGAPFGNYEQYSHYVYTSTFEALIGGRVLEGEGLTPDEEVLRINDPTHSFLPQLDAAINYIAAH